ncbi:PbsX family transcriptional regulator, partial [Salmonella enterica]|nr:PbsX family transcriptional regulator [Salmonella enterica]
MQPLKTAGSVLGRIKASFTLSYTKETIMNLTKNCAPPAID